ncbi:MAG: tetratricopeptide repeat protein [Aulosira sp. DedQUE10]|nr:tetratricopeptide repeat protein [Aulosira sp. DedQUE10]
MTLNPNLSKLLQQGHDQLDGGNYHTGLEIFYQAAALKPQNPQVLYGLGLACYRLERYQDAIGYCNQALAIEPNYILALAWRGLTYKELEQTQLAQADFEQVIALTPQDTEDWQGRGLALDDLGRYEEAIAFYDKAIEIKTDYHHAWGNRGNALRNLGRYEEAIASYDQAIEIKPDYHLAWYSRGSALDDLGRYEEAIASYDKALEIQPKDYKVWDHRGDTLWNLGQYKEALISYDKAIEIKPDYYYPWYSRGVILCDFLHRYEEAITSFDQVLKLTNNQTWKAWYNRGVALSKSGNKEYAIMTLDEGVKALQLGNSEYEEGCGELYSYQGNLLYNYGKQQPNPFPDWFLAKASYEKALNFLSFDKFPQLHLQVLEKLLQVCTALGDIQTFKTKQEEATQRLEELVVNCQPKEREISLRRKFAAFNQFRVDIRLKSPNKQQHIEALELAEERKNICLAWLREGWDYQPHKFTYQDMQRLLNPKTAAVYWHVSPIAITTFIVKHNQPPVVLQPQLPPKLQKQNYPAHTYQLQRFQEWMQKWKQAYQDYCQDNYTGTTKESASWRENMEYMLQNQLRNILEINRIRDELKGIEQLILIPHRELHLLPLDYLFPERFNITYLPSFQIGVKLLAQENLFNQVNASQNIVNVATSDLPFATIESVALAAMYPQVRQLQIPPAKQNNLIAELGKNRGLFHFTGHSDHIPEEPRESFLMLAGSDKLTLGNIVDDDNIDLSQYAVICLSSCETGITSSETLTDEYVGLVSGFLAKGANYVVSTLWRVDERSTAILMIKFYELLKTGNAPSIALREAKQWLHQLTYQGLADWYNNLAHNLNEPQVKDYLITEAKMIESDSDRMNSTTPVYAHPYYWAGFILTGKPV